MKTLRFVKIHRCYLSAIFVLLFTSCSANQKSKEKTSTQVQKTNNLKYRGVVYDVGLQFNPGSYSVETFNPDLVKYDMSIIANKLNANTVRVEGEDISRLVKATEIAHRAGLKVFFNPWKMGANAEETIAYMKDASIAAEKLRLKGIDLVFVAGCEYSLFSKGVFQGETLNDRLAYMIKAGTTPDYPQGKNPVFIAAYEKLNSILSDICKEVRSQFKGSVTYSSGTWENIDWDLFDIIGVDYYRNGESEEEYIAGLDRYKSSKPLFVMEVGSCTYEGAAQRGGGGFMILQGMNPDGTGIYEGGKIPVRSEKEQADYIEHQINALQKADVDGVFIYVFAFPIMPFSEEKGKDMDMTSYSLVKSFSKQDSRSQKIPNWEPKEAYKRLSEVYSRMSKTKEYDY
ncbi:hypothetical protein [Carboxylicivirga linearis]|uniref:Abortive infection protein n=1 Tax=Carboxylicivirga linearis TaxID=1628157 RepID=A0ABS5K1D4_9BACT|nr:hypothetical protein [Carboxylicivirga linearis]MBS2100933.1 hypothetical protein [Carboxylicivirga linearis]